MKAGRPQPGSQPHTTTLRRPAALHSAPCQPTLHQASHLAWASGWKRLEPYWDTHIRTGHVSAILPDWMSPWSPSAA